MNWPDRKLKRLDEGIETRMELLAGRRRALGEDDPVTLDTRHDVVFLLDEAGRHDEAMKAAWEVVEARRRVLGESHPDTVKSLERLAKILQGQGEFAEGRRCLVEILEINNQAHGPRSSESIDTLGDLIELHDAWHEAEPSSGHDVEAGRYRRILEESSG